jgi:hypothetical protein
MAAHNPSTVRSAALRSSALSFEKAISIGLKSGEPGGRKSSRAPAGPVWLPRLSITTVSPGASSGTSTRSTEVWKASRLIEPSSTNGAARPDRRRPATKVVVFQ